MPRRTVRIAQFALLIAMLCAGILGVLAWAQIGFAKIDSNKSSAQVAIELWPGCAMAVHENLAGGLIGAAGALIAGLLAWRAVRDQINDARASLADEKQARLIIQKRSAETEISRLQRYKDILITISVKSTLSGGQQSIIEASRSIVEINKVSLFDPVWGPVPNYGGAAEAQDIVQRLKLLAARAEPLIPATGLPQDIINFMPINDEARRGLNRLSKLTIEISAALIQVKSEVQDIDEKLRTLIPTPA